MIFGRYCDWRQMPALVLRVPYSTGKCSGLDGHSNLPQRNLLPRPQRQPKNQNFDRRSSWIASLLLLRSTPTRCWRRCWPHPPIHSRLCSALRWQKANPKLAGEEFNKDFAAKQPSDYTSVQALVAFPSAFEVIR